MAYDANYGKTLVFVAPHSNTKTIALKVDSAKAVFAEVDYLAKPSNIFSYSFKPIFWKKLHSIIIHVLDSIFNNASKE